MTPIYTIYIYIYISGAIRLVLLSAALLNPSLYVAEADVHRGGQERRWHPEHQRSAAAAPQAQRQPATAESQTDVQGNVRSAPKERKSHTVSHTVRLT